MKSEIKIQNSHDFISVITPNSRFTMNRSGYKVSGLLCLPEYSKCCNDIITYVDKSVKTMTYGEIAEELQKFKILELFPDCIKIAESINIGDEIKFKAPLNKKYPSSYIVVKIAKTNVFVQINGSLIGFNKNFTQKVVTTSEKVIIKSTKIITQSTKQEKNSHSTSIRKI